MKVFFRKEMVSAVDSYSPSAGKPALAVASWQERFGNKIEVVGDFEPATPEDLAMAHDPGYVHDVLNGYQSNGFGTRDPEVAKTCLYTCGSMIAASRSVLAKGGIACSPTSGFHHAGYDFGGGFCTFNGLIVAALDALEVCGAQRVGVLDMDEHYGNGTDDIIRHKRLRDRVIHYSIEGRARDASWVLDGLDRKIQSWYRGCDLLIYQAGADAHIDDPLGGWMTGNQLRQRDRVVFRTADWMKLPVVWNLAGGYRRDANRTIRPVLDIHDATMDEALNWS